MGFFKTTLIGVAAVMGVATGSAFAWRGYLIHELRNPVLEQLTDPQSAIFRSEVYAGDWTVSGGILCGQVNAKNRMGGYVGYKWFHSFNQHASVESDSMKESFDLQKVKRCDFSGDKVSWWQVW